jgi:large subunit ribosomal protein L1
VDELIRAKPAAAKGRYLRSVTLTSSMGPGIKIDPTRTKGVVAELEEEPAAVTA